MLSLDNPAGGARPSRRRWIIGAAVVLFAAAVVIFMQRHGSVAAPPPAPAAASRPALTVALVTPQTSDWPQRLPAQGSIAAWQEAVIGAELAGFRVTEVLVNVGDHVRKGQTLARISVDTVSADVAQARAAVAEADASLADALANAKRTQDLQAKGFISPQAHTQAVTNEQTAIARLAAARARLQAEEVRLGQTRVLAPDDGVISVRNATVGSLTQPGQELFRLIRGHRLEWRAEVTRVGGRPAETGPAGHALAAEWHRNQGQRAHGGANDRPGDAHGPRVRRPARFDTSGDHPGRHVCARRIRTWSPGLP